MQPYRRRRKSGYRETLLRVTSGDRMPCRMSLTSDSSDPLHFDQQAYTNAEPAPVPKASTDAPAAVAPE